MTQQDKNVALVNGFDILKKLNMQLVTMKPDAEL